MINTVVWLSGLSALLAVFIMIEFKIPISKTRALSVAVIFAGIAILSLTIGQWLTSIAAGVASICWCILGFPRLYR